MPIEDLLKNLTEQFIELLNNSELEQIGNFFSECLVLGVYNEKNEVVLLQPDQMVNNGDKIG